MKRRAAALLAIVSIGAAPVPFADLASRFDEVAGRTEGRSDVARIAAVRTTIEPVLPGLYPNDARVDRRITAALAQLPAIRPAYRRAVARFPGALDEAVGRFRHVFPRFASPMPIYLVHSLGIRDGGSDFLEPGHRKVMLFGADMIARYHDDATLQPFLAHELFHLEHARHFADCDRLWCGLWQEGLAVAATATFFPDASDAALLLTQPEPIRAATDAAWPRALCHIAGHFDDTDPAAIDAVLTGGEPPPGLPPRFGYYVGLRIAGAAGQPLARLAMLDHEMARPIVRAALAKLLAVAKAPCPPPPFSAPSTRTRPRAA